MRSNFDWKLNDIYYFSELYSSPKHRKEIDKGYYVSWKKIFWLILGYILWTYETSLIKITNPSYTLLWFERYKDYPFLFKRLWKPFSSRMLRWNWPSDFEEDFLKNPIIFFTLSWFFFPFWRETGLSFDSPMILYAKLGCNFYFNSICNINSGNQSYISFKSINIVILIYKYCQNNFYVLFPIASHSILSAASIPIP